MPSMFLNVAVGLLAFMMTLLWVSLAGRISSSTLATSVALESRLSQLDSATRDALRRLDALQTVAEDTRTRSKAVAEMLMQQRRAAERDKGGGAAQTVRLAISISTMRRGLAGDEYVFGTIDSLIPHLGTEGRLDTSLVVVDVERGDGAFGRQIEARYQALVSAGMLRVRHLDDAARLALYAELTQTCRLHRLYDDDLTRVIWRSKRVLDLVFALRLAAADADYVMVLEDDTPVVGSLPAAALQCHDTYGPGRATACRWDFYWSQAEAQTKLVSLAAPAAHAPAKLMYPQGDLQGAFALMLPTADWLVLCDWMRQHFDKAPADWLIGRWLFLQNWRIAFMPAILIVYHRAQTNFADSSRLAVAKGLASDPLFAATPLTWQACPHTPENSVHAFKWDGTEPGATLHYRLRWVGGADLYLEVPWTDITGNDVGISRDAALMDEDARIIVCEKTPACRAINAGGWMKRSLAVDRLSAPDKTKKLFVRVPASASPQQLAEIRDFYLSCWARLPEAPPGMRAPLTLPLRPGPPSPPPSSTTPASPTQAPSKPRPI